MLELLVVIVLITSVATVAIPMYQSIRAKQEMQSIVQLLPNVLRFAKQEAFLRHQDIVVCPSLDRSFCSSHSDWSTYLLVFVDNNSNRKRDSQEEILAHYALNVKYAELKRSGARRASYLFFKKSNALAQGSQGSFVYCSLVNPDLHRKIVLNAMGHTRVETLRFCDYSAE